MEKSLAQIVMEAFLATSYSDQDTYERVANAVEKAVLARLNKSEPVAGQELTFVQVAQWIENHGSAKGLQLKEYTGKWWDVDEVTTVIYVDVVYRVAPKKVNAPIDPTTWEKGVAIFRRDAEDDAWILDVFEGYAKGATYKYCCRCSIYKYAKLATPEQVEAWRFINDTL